MQSWHNGTTILTCQVHAYCYTDYSSKLLQCTSLHADVGVGLFGSSVTKFVLNSSNVNLDLNVGDPAADHVCSPIPILLILAI